MSIQPQNPSFFENVKKAADQVVNYVKKGEQLGGKAIPEDASAHLKRERMSHFPQAIYKQEGGNDLSILKQIANGVFFGFNLIFPPFLGAHALTIAVIKKISKTENKDLLRLKDDYKTAIKANYVKQLVFEGKIHTLKSEIQTLEGKIQKKEDQIQKQEDDLRTKEGEILTFEDKIKSNDDFIQMLLNPEELITEKKKLIDQKELLKNDKYSSDNGKEYLMEKKMKLEEKLDGLQKKLVNIKETSTQLETQLNVMDNKLNIPIFDREMEAYVSKREVILDALGRGKVGEYDEYLTNESQITYTLDESSAKELIKNLSSLNESFLLKINDLIKLSNPSGDTNNKSDVTMGLEAEKEKFIKEFAPDSVNVSAIAPEQVHQEDIKTGQLQTGREKLLEEMRIDPGQLMIDINRLGIVTIGNTTIEKGQYEALNKNEIKQDMTERLTEYIQEQKQTNSSINLNEAKINEIMYSSTQSAANDLNRRRRSQTPDYPWGSLANGPLNKSELSFKFENNRSDVLVVSRKTTKLYQNLDDDEDPHRLVVTDARVKHNLRTNEVTYEYELSITDAELGLVTSEIWDPTKEIFDEKTDSWVPLRLNDEI